MTGESKEQREDEREKVEDKGEGDGGRRGRGGERSGGGIGSMKKGRSIKKYRKMGESVKGGAIKEGLSKRRIMYCALYCLRYWVGNVEKLQKKNKTQKIEAFLETDGV